MMTREGGAQPKEYLVKYAADRVRTVGDRPGSARRWAAASATTTSSTRSRTKDFYSLAAFFADVKQWGVYPDYGYTPNPDLKGWTNDHPFPPEIEVDSPYLQRRSAARRSRSTASSRRRGAKLAATARGGGVRSVGRTLRGVRPDQPRRLGDAPTPSSRPSEGGQAVATADRQRREPASVDGEAADEQRSRSGSTPAAGLASRRSGSSCCRTRAQGEGRPRRRRARRLIRLVRRRAGRRDGRSTSRWPSAHADADHKEPRYCERRRAPRHPGRLEDVEPSTPTAPQTAVWLLDRPVRLAEGDAVVVDVTSDDVGCVRVSRLAVRPRGPARTDVGSRPGAGEPPTRDDRGTTRPLRGVPARHRLGRRRPARRSRRCSARSLECRDGKALVDGHARPCSRR